jgi:hypothetical protein
MQSSILSSNALSSRSHHRTRFNGAAARGKTSSSKRQQSLRVVAKDFPKPEQIDKTENYRIAGELSKRFVVRTFTTFSVLSFSRVYRS